MFKSIILASALMFTSASVMAADKAITAESASSSAKLTIQKMNCGGCAAKVKKVLAKVEGIGTVKTTPKTRLVEIQIKDSSKFDLAKTIAAIKAGTGWDAVASK
ncbi:MAG: heavy-metal-associated domain-containing protein [Lentisphaeraceae bacterium]|nr:heavy-metal-associated domain-containing protein [Lentisphaeraceae bacterium]